MTGNRDLMYLYEYEELLMGRINNFSYAFSGTLKDRQHAAGVIWRYAIEHLLKWSPSEACNNLTDKIVSDLKLDKCYPGIGFNKKTDFHVNYKFILQYAFPESITWNLKDEAIFCYERSAKLGRFKHSKEDVRLPKMFYMNTDGLERIRVLLLYVENLYLTDMSNEEQYGFFANTTEAKRFLKEKKLTTAFRFSTYETPLEYHHYSMPAHLRSNLYFYANRANELCSNEIKKQKKMEKETRRQSGTIAR